MDSARYSLLEILSVTFGRDTLTARVVVDCAARDAAFVCAIEYTPRVRGEGGVVESVRIVSAHNNDGVALVPTAAEHREVARWCDADDELADALQLIFEKERDIRTAELRYA